ncbi:MAG: hypothetical protein BMS9Abin29_2255 [Gemmatimonadota bacterium]|nr:MAG: hypothetical protein BMS9Abin29_2255 [Gemmatimonadota bacterium]
MTDDRFEEFLKVHGDGYNSPPAAPKDAMWRAIEGALAEEGTTSEADVPSLASSRVGKQASVHRWRQGWGVWATAAAAVLVVGVGIGRMSVTPPASGASGVAIMPEARTRAMRTVALRYLARTESLLTMVSSDARLGTVDAEIGQWGQGLLVQTRLLLDSPAAGDPVIRRLLGDLETILIQVAGLSSAGRDTTSDREELEMIAEGLRDQDMMLRIRSVIPIGTVQRGI